MELTDEGTNTASPLGTLGLLPPELRGIIYQFLVEGDGSEWSLTTASLTRLRSNQYLFHHLSCLNLVSKTVRADVEACFFRTHLLSLELNYSVGDGQFASPKLVQITVRIRGRVEKAPLYLPVTITVKPLERYSVDYQSYEPRRGLSLEQVSARLIIKLHAFASYLKVAKINILCADLESVPQSHFLTSLPLRAICKLRNFQELTVTCPLRIREGENRPGANTTTESFKQAWLFITHFTLGPGLESATTEMVERGGVKIQRDKWVLMFRPLSWNNGERAWHQRLNFPLLCWQ